MWVLNEISIRILSDNIHILAIGEQFIITTFEIVHSRNTLQILRQAIPRLDHPIAVKVSPDIQPAPLSFECQLR